MAEEAGAAPLLDRAEARGLRLRRATAVVDDTGWDFHVVDVADETGTRWILRAPRRPETADRIAAEAAVLALVAPLLPVQVPHWRLADRDLIAYPRLPGAPAGAEDPVTLAYRWSDGAADPGADYTDTLAAALAALHRIRPEAVMAAGAADRPTGRARQEAARELAEARERLPLPDDRYTHWSRWLDDDRYWPADQRLTHGDVHPGHTLVTPAGPGHRPVTGLLDWTNAAVADPAADFVDLCLAGGPALLDRVLAAYRRYGGEDRAAGAGLRDRVLAHAAFRWVHVALLGLSTGRPGLTAAARSRMAGPVPPLLTGSG